MKIRFNPKTREYEVLNKISEEDRQKLIAQDIAAEKAKAKKREEDAAREWLSKNPPPKPKPQPVVLKKKEAKTNAQVGK